MYFPYLRGRQYELLALRELVSKGLLSEHIIPIVEPVKLSITLIKTLVVFNSKNRKIAIIQNPSVGSFDIEIENTELDDLQKKYFGCSANEHIIESYIMDEKVPPLEERGASMSNWLIVNQNVDDVELFNGCFAEFDPKYVLVPENSRRRIKKGVNKVLFRDNFNKQNRNSDYLKNDDEFFSDDQEYFSEEGYIGFGDYSIISEEYQESGFAPYAVAIHIVYFDDNDALKLELRVHHFVSDSNDDIRNPAGKFYEAVEKLDEWWEERSPEEKEQNSSAGLNELLQHFKDGTYPGLGSVKKYSLMHHFEIIGRYLNNEVQA
jgi:hypothetical protein